MIGFFDYKQLNITPCIASPNLEKTFEEYQIQEIDVARTGQFDEYLSPNEGHPEEIEKHLQLAEKGIHVCTGTERSFFHLLSAHEDKCEGLVIRDINPKVKAYVDFNLLLIRISNTREEYLLWSSLISDSEFFERTITILTQQINDSPLPYTIKQYYLKNARAFGEIYQKTDKSWIQNRHFEKVNYHLHDHLFQKIKSYAMEGKIITTVGKINDLQFLRHYHVSAVDTSNISDYSMLDFHAEGNFHPRVIWTKLHNPINTGSSLCAHTQFYSYIHQSLDSDEREKFDILKQKITLAHNSNNFDSWLSLNTATLHKADVFSSDIGPFYTKNTLKYLEDFVDIHIFQIESSYPIYMHRRSNLKTFNTLSLNKLLTIAVSKEIKPFVTCLVSNWQVFNASVLKIFSYIEEWNTALEKHFKYTPGELQGFLRFLNSENALGEFTSSFGETRLAELKKSCKDALKTKNSHRIRG